MGRRQDRRRRRRRLVSIALLAYPEKHRKEHKSRPRLDWNFEVERLLHEGEFKRTYRMTASSFQHLCCLLTQLDRPAQAWINRSPVSIANKLQMTIRFLCGGMVDDFRRDAGVDRSYSYKVIKAVMQAITEVTELKICFPMSPSDRELAVNGFAERSNHRAINECVGAMDGWLCNIQAPSEADSGGAARARRYFSGHYMHHGVNVQACCDVFSRFVFVEATHPGGVNDSRAYEDSGLPSVIEGLERGLYVVADAAYTATNHLLTPYMALQSDEVFKDSFNYHLSQVRIRIEMAFGLLTRKWGIFHHPLQCSLTTTTLIIKCAMMLHNFCVNQRLVSCRDPVYEDLLHIAQEQRCSLSFLLTYERDWSLEAQTHSFVRDGIVAKLRRSLILRAN